MKVVAPACPEIAGIGLVRTGTGSLSRSFPGKQVSHEWGMPALRPAALDRVDGLLDDDAFLEATRERLVLGAAQVDVSTVHHLYVDVLTRIWPSTRFVITVRDVRSWTSSVLGLIQRKNAYLQGVGQGLPAEDARYHRHLTGSAGRPFEQSDADDVIPLMRYWTAHLQRVKGVLDADRVEYRYIVGGGGPRVNSSPFPGLDRFMIGDRAALHAAYEATCASLMREFFPREHAQLMRDWDEQSEPNWDEFAGEVRAWADTYVASGSPPPGASGQGWT